MERSSVNNFACQEIPININELKRLGITPYQYLSRALTWLLLFDNPYAAKEWIRYAEKYELYFENKAERESFIFMTDLCKLFIVLYENGIFEGNNEE